jgi:hypothetical protein
VPDYPPAPTWDVLYRFEDYIEAAAKSVLKSRGFVSVYIQQDTDDIVTPRVSLQFTVTGAIEHYGIREIDQQLFVDRWQGRLTAAIVTDRSVNKHAHSAIRAKTRQYLSQWQLYNTTLLLPYHELVRCMEGPSSPIIRAEEDEDVSEISWDIIFGIRSWAWPEEADPTT